MLDQIHYSDHAVLKLTFEEGAYHPRAGGSISYSVDRVSDIKIPDEEELKELFQISEGDWLFFDTINVSIDAQNKETEDSAFNLKAVIELLYHFPVKLKEELTSEFFAREEWYFSNNAYQVAHQVVSSLLEHSKYKSVVYSLPRFREDNSSSSGE